VNATNVEALAEHYKNENWSYGKPDIFKEQLRLVIRQRSISIKEYDEITCEEFDSLDELYNWLKEVWKHVVGESLI